MDLLIWNSPKKEVFFYTIKLLFSPKYISLSKLLFLPLYLKQGKRLLSMSDFGAQKCVLYTRRHGKSTHKLPKETPTTKVKNTSSTETFNEFTLWTSPSRLCSRSRLRFLCSLATNGSPHHEERMLKLFLEKGRKLSTLSSRYLLQPFSSLATQVTEQNTPGPVTGRGGSVPPGFAARNNEARSPTQLDASHRRTRQDPFAGN